MAGYRQTKSGHSANRVTRVRRAYTRYSVNGATRVRFKPDGSDNLYPLIALTSL